MTIQEAMTKLRNVIPAHERSIFISCSVNDYNHIPVGDPNRLAISFRVWDERDSYEDTTLEGAVDKCLQAIDAGSGSAAEAEAFLFEAANT